MIKVVLGLVIAAGFIAAPAQGRAQTPDIKAEATFLATVLDEAAEPCKVERERVKALLENKGFSSLGKAVRAKFLAAGIGCSYYPDEAHGIDLAQRLEPIAEQPQQVGMAAFTLFYAAEQRVQFDAAHLIKALEVWTDVLHDPSSADLWRYMRHAKATDRKTFLRVMKAILAQPWNAPEIKTIVANGIAYNYAIELANDRDMDGVRAAIIRMDDPTLLIKIAQDRRFESLWAELEAHGRFNWSIHREFKLADLRNKAAADPTRVELAVNLIEALEREQELTAAIELGESWRVRIKGGEVFPDEENVHWLLDNYGEALLAAGRIDEARTVYAEAIAASRDDKVSQRINWAEHLVEHGLFEEARSTYAQINPANASPYGRAWIQAGMVCANAPEHRGEAEPIVSEMRRHWKDNSAAYEEALLCLNLQDEAADLYIKRLADKEQRRIALEAVRIAPAPKDATAHDFEIDQRKQTVLAHPKVAAAINAVGRRLEAPVELTSFGNL